MGERVDIGNNFCPNWHTGDWSEHATEQNDDEYEKHDQEHGLLQGVGIVGNDDAQSSYSKNENDGCHIQRNDAARRK